MLVDHTRDGLRNGIHRIRQAHLLELVEHARAAEHVADAHAGERERLAERAQDDQVLVLLERRAHREAAELEVGLVDHDERVGRVEDALHLAAREQVARGVVGARYDREVDVALRQALAHGVNVNGVVAAARHLHHLGVREERVVRVDRERRRHVEELAAGAAPRQREVEQQLVAAVAQEHLVAVEAVGFCDLVAQVVGQRVRVAVEADLAHGVLDLAADLEVHVARVLVGRDHDLGRDVFRIVRLYALKLRRGGSHLLHDRSFLPWR